jgi:protocatechuate 3,4-dioxygenase alpha subunit
MSRSGTSIATSSQTVGPFFHFGLTTNASLSKMAADTNRGQRIELRLRLLDGEGLPVPDAMIEAWHRDQGGGYLFGRVASDADGMCVFETVYPAGPEDGGEAVHVNLCVFMRGLLRHLYTRVYFANDAALPNDPVLSLIPQERRTTLVAREVAGTPGTWSLDLRLQGNAETVYFDL